MKKILLATVLGTSLTVAASHAMAANLSQVYQSAVKNDPTFKQAEANLDIAQQDVPESIAPLLPQINMTGTGEIQTQDVKGHNVTDSTGTPTETSIDTHTKDRSLGFQITLQQSIFNFTNWMNLASARYSVRAAYATYTAAAQDLIQRTSQAYFNVLLAEDNLRYTGSEKRAFYRQYIQAKESYDVGVKTITDVYNAKAAYDGAIADYVAAKNNLADSKQDLQAITGVYYNHLSPLIKLPLVKPVPSNIKAWSQIATQHNWTLRAAHLSAIAAHKSIAAAEGGHVPSLAFNGSFSNTQTDNIGRPGGNRTKVWTTGLELTVPVFSGGAVTAQVNQSIGKYDLAIGQMEQAYRDAINQANKAYLGSISGISKVNADRQAVISQRSSLEGTEEGYKVGTRTMVDVLNAEKNLYNAERERSKDRYTYVMSLIDLKQAAGTLNVADVSKVNSWLRSWSSYKVKRKTTHKRRRQHKHHVVKKPSTIKTMHREPLHPHTPTKPTHKPVEHHAVVHKTTEHKKPVEMKKTEHKAVVHEVKKPVHQEAKPAHHVVKPIQESRVKQYEETRKEHEKIIEAQKAMNKGHKAKVDLKPVSELPMEDKKVSRTARYQDTKAEHQRIEENVKAIKKPELKKHTAKPVPTPAELMDEHEAFAIEHANDLSGTQKSKGLYYNADMQQAKKEEKPKAKPESSDKKALDHHEVIRRMKEQAKQQAALSAQ